MTSADQLLALNLPIIRNAEIDRSTLDDGPWVVGSEIWYTDSTIVNGSWARETCIYAFPIDSFPADT
jgi:hypothetical protein